MTKIWIDADAIPGAVKDIVIGATRRLKIETVFVANKQLLLPSSPFISFVQVDATLDAADNFIKEHANKNDLVVTQDIPLAHDLVNNDVVVINPRGDVLNNDNIGDRISMRNLMQDLRDIGEISGGPKSFGNKEKQAFASAFDREITKLKKRNSP